MTTANTYNNSIGEAIKLARHAKGLSQEDFGIVSSRTYVSSLERGLKSPTIKKLDSLAATIGIHPLTLLTMAYLENPSRESPTTIFNKVAAELETMQQLDSTAIP